MYDAAELSQLPGLLAGELISIGRALAGTTRENICAILDVAIARATVSESLAYERLENMLFAEQRGDDAEIERDEAIARAEAAEARVAELEAASDAQGWRPVTEKPLIAMQYQVVVQHSRQQPAADHMAYYPSSGWTGTDVIYWRPIPPLPAPDANEEPTS